MLRIHDVNFVDLVSIVSVIVFGARGLDYVDFVAGSIYCVNSRLEIGYGSINYINSFNSIVREGARVIEQKYSSQFGTGNVASAL